MQIVNPQRPTIVPYSPTQYDATVGIPSMPDIDANPASGTAAGSSGASATAGTASGATSSPVTASATTASPSSSTGALATPSSSTPALSSGYETNTLPPGYAFTNGQPSGLAWNSFQQTLSDKYDAPDLHYYAMTRADYGRLAKMLSERDPSAWYGIKYIFVVPSHLVSLSPPVSWHGVSISEMTPIDTLQKVLSHDISAGDFGYTIAKNIPKMYGGQFSAIRISDPSRPESTVDITVSQTSGTMAVWQTMSAIAPYLRVDAIVSGIGGSDSRTVSVAPISPSETVAVRIFDGETLKYSWNPPQFCLYGPRALEKASNFLASSTRTVIAKNNFSLAIQRAESSYEIAMCEIDARLAAALSSADVSLSTASASADSLLSMTTASAQTTRSGAVAGAATASSTGTASAMTSESTAVASAMTSESTAVASAGTALSTATASAMTGESTAVASAATARSAARARAATESSTSTASALSAETVDVMAAQLRRSIDQARAVFPYAAASAEAAVALSAAMATAQVEQAIAVNSYNLNYSNSTQDVEMAYTATTNNIDLSTSNGYNAVEYSDKNFSNVNTYNAALTAAFGIYNAIAIEGGGSPVALSGISTLLSNGMSSGGTPTATVSPGALSSPPNSNGSQMIGVSSNVAVVSNTLLMGAGIGLDLALGAANIILAQAQQSNYDDYANTCVGNNSLSAGITQQGQRDASNNNIQNTLRSSTVNTSMSFRLAQQIAMSNSTLRNLVAGKKSATDISIADATEATSIAQAGITRSTAVSNAAARLATGYSIADATYTSDVSIAAARRATAVSNASSQNTSDVSIAAARREMAVSVAAANRATEISNVAARYATASSVADAILASALSNASTDNTTKNTNATSVNYTTKSIAENDAKVARGKAVIELDYARTVATTRDIIDASSQIIADTGSDLIGPPLSTGQYGGDWEDWRTGREGVNIRFISSNKSIENAAAYKWARLGYAVPPTWVSVAHRDMSIMPSVTYWRYAEQPTITSDSIGQAARENIAATLAAGISWWRDPSVPMGLADPINNLSIIE